MIVDPEGTPAIRTPDQRLRVFISSTIAELASERKSVARAIAAVGLTPVLFELGARPYPPRELYRAYLAQSDIFIGLYWQRYGWVGPDMDISGLEDEFRLSESIPRLLYVKTPAPDRESGLTAMIDEIKAKGTESYRTFKTTRELGRLVRDDLAVLLSERFAARIEPIPSAAPSAEPSIKARRTRSVPMPSTSLIGRDDDIAEILELLEAPENRLIVLTGPGGIGKTRLAIAVADRLEDSYPPGAIFLSLDSIARPELAMRRIAAAVGATLEGARDPVDVVAEYVADTPTMLVLDGLEQVTEIATELDQLLMRCPGLRIIATSRTVLRIRAERDYPVDPLTVPRFSERPALEELASLPAVRLFVDRAKAVRYDFALTEDNAIAVAEICRRLDGLPLAIELAAARTRLLEPAEVLQRLSGSLDALGTGPVDLPERQRTLRATVEWSVGLLNADEHQMLSTLSSFVDGWTVDAAVQVSGLDEVRVLDLIDGLAGHSLVTVDVAHGSPRFGMLTSVHEMAAERLAAQEDAAHVARRHAEYFRNLVEAFEWPAERQTAWAERLRPEEGNLRAVVVWHLAHDISPLPHMFRILWLFWQLSDHMPEGRAWIEELMPRAGELEDRAQFELMIVSAMTAAEVGDDGGALVALDGIRRLEGRLRDPALESTAQLAISWVLPITDDIDGALRAASTAAAGFREQGDPFLTWAVYTVGLFELTLDQLDAAKASLTEAREFGDRLGNPWLRTATRALLASLAVRNGRLREARAILAEVTDPHRLTDLSAQALTFALVAYVRLALADGNPQRAAAALGAIDGLRERVGLKAWPSMRGNEKGLAAQIGEALSQQDLGAARLAGASLRRAQTIALVRGEALPAEVLSGG